MVVKTSCWLAAFVSLSLSLCHHSCVAVGKCSGSTEDGAADYSIGRRITNAPSLLATVFYLYTASVLWKETIIDMWKEIVACLLIAMLVILHLSSLLR